MKKLFLQRFNAQNLLKEDIGKITTSYVLVVEPDFIDIPAFQNINITKELLDRQLLDIRLTCSLDKTFGGQFYWLSCQQMTSEKSFAEAISQLPGETREKLATLANLMSDGKKYRKIVHFPELTGNDMQYFNLQGKVSLSEFYLRAHDLQKEAEERAAIDSIPYGLHAIKRFKAHVDYVSMCLAEHHECDAYLSANGKICPVD